MTQDRVRSNAGGQSNAQRPSGFAA